MFTKYHKMFIVQIIFNKLEKEIIARYVNITNFLQFILHSKFSWLGSGGVFKFVYPE